MDLAHFVCILSVYCQDAIYFVREGCKGHLCRRRYQPLPYFLSALCIPLLAAGSEIIRSIPVNQTHQWSWIQMKIQRMEMQRRSKLKGSSTKKVCFQPLSSSTAAPRGTSRCGSRYLEAWIRIPQGTPQCWFLFFGFLSNTNVLLIWQCCGASFLWSSSTFDQASQ